MLRVNSKSSRSEFQTAGTATENTPYIQ